MAQLRQWITVSREYFPPGSPELQNLQELYERELDAISDAEDKLLDEPEVAIRDMQFFNTTFESSDRDLRKEDWEELMRQMESAKDLASAMSNS